DWTMSSWVGLAWVIVAEPAVTCPPLGLAKAGGTATDRAPTTIVAAPTEAASADTGVGQASALGALRGTCAQLLPTTRLIRLSGCGRQSGSWVRLRLVLVLWTSPTYISIWGSARSRTPGKFAIKTLSDPVGI